jgi:hypothetical protein
MTKEISIKDSLNSKDLFGSFKQQLKKDLQECGCEHEFVEGLLPEMDMIKQALGTVLKAHDKKPGFNIRQLLYRVDINEKQLGKQLAEQKEEEYLSVVAELMIKRILQKVVLRKYFSNNDQKG